MGVKCKIFENDHPCNIEEYVNDFLADGKKIFVSSNLSAYKSIEYQSGDEYECMHTVLVLFYLEKSSSISQKLMRR